MTNTQPNNLTKIMDDVRDPRAAALARLNTALSDIASEDDDADFESAKENILRSILELRTADSVPALIEFEKNARDDEEFFNDEEFLKKVKLALTSLSHASKTVEDRIVDHFAIARFFETLGFRDNIKIAEDYNKVAYDNLKSFGKDYNKTLKALETVMGFYLPHGQDPKDGDFYLSERQVESVDAIVVAEVKRFAASPTDNDPVLADGLSRLVNRLETYSEFDELDQLLFDKMSNKEKYRYVEGAINGRFADIHTGDELVSNPILKRYGDTWGKVLKKFGEEPEDVDAAVRKEFNLTNDLGDRSPNLG